MSKANKKKTIFIASGSGVVGGFGRACSGVLMATALSKLRKYLCSLEKKHLGSSGKTRPASSLPGELCRHFSLDEIKKATCSFNKELFFAEGVLGTVYKGFIDKDNSRPVAVKRLKPPFEEYFRTEALLLCQIRHVNVIPFIGYCEDEGEMILVYDFMANKTLFDHLYDSDNAPLLWKQRLQICIVVARGLHYLHTELKHTVIHSDVKTTSILLDDKWVAKIATLVLSKVVLNNIKSGNLVVDMEGTREPLDFGSSQQISSNTTASYNDLSGIYTEVAGTLGYLDPEYHKSSRLTAKSDVYSFGVVLLEVLCARVPLDERLKGEQMYLGIWAQKCNENGSIGNIIDPYLKGKIAPECFKVYVDVAMQNQGIQRPTMVDVIERLELALELQEKADSVI